jgi:formate dehydrogenase major subunit/formate dehydrogenase alpha subunit
MIQLTINDQLLEAREGQTILEAARDHGITIPTLCYHKDLSPVGSCRLCVVEVAKIRGQVAACTQAVSDGMIVRTETPSIVQSRQMVLQLLLSNYVDAGYAEHDQHQTEFMHWINHYDVHLPIGFTPRNRYKANSDPNPFVWVDWDKCILCTRCVRACTEVQGRFVWGVAQRGLEAKIVSGADTTLIDARCESCGACVAYCPTGALDNKMSVGLGIADKLVTTTCTYCGVGCQFDLNVQNDRIIRVTSNPNAAVNGMALCVKGRYGYDFVHHADRLTKPRVRKYLLEGLGIRDQGSGTPHFALRTSYSDRGEWVDVEWDTAYNIIAKKLIEVKTQSGPDAIGVLASAKCTNEENYLMQKFARQVIGTHNVDHCARLCHSSTVAGLAMCYGSGAMSNTIQDICDNAKAIFIIGSNTTEQHPVFGAKIRQAVLKRGVKLIVADPRKIDITEFATLHIRQKPGTDVALINGLMHIIYKNNWHDQKYIDERCENFEEFRATIEKYTPELVSEITGISIEQLHQTAELISINKPMAVFWAMGITQHTTGVFNVLSLGNLQMLLGNMGVPGGGVNPLRGQNNVQGACDMGALPNVFPGYQAVTDEKNLLKFSEAWKLKDLNLSNRPGLTVTEMIPQAGEGKIRALYILGEDPMLTDPDLNHVRECLEAAEFIVLQEIFPSETSQFADVLLPGASFAEKDGTFTNTERRVQLIREAIKPIGESRPDWLITAQLAQRLLDLEARQPIGPQANWNYASPSDIMNEIAQVTPSYAGVNFDRLNRGEQLHWPVKSIDHPGTPILHIGQFTRGKGKFHAIDHLPAKELPDAEYPIVLTTGRVLYHWHGGEMTRRAQGLLEIYPESLIEINPEDALALGLNGSRTVKVTSRRGEMIAEAIITDRVSPGLIFGNFHFPGAQNVNNVTIGALDPIAKIPEYKVCAVRIERVEK